MARNVLYVGDTLPIIPATIKDGSGNVIDLTSYTVKFSLRQWYAASNTFGPNPGTVVNGPLGQVTYTLGTNDLAGLTPGIYFGQWTLTTGATSMHVDAGEFEVRIGQ